MNIVRTEPARVVAIILAILGVATAFGLGVTHGQSDAIVSLVGAVLAIIGGETVRAQVMPVAKIVTAGAPESSANVQPPAVVAPEAPAVPPAAQ